MWNQEHSLYPFQARASETMCESDILLAFTMGAGKTPTTLHALETLRDQGEVEGCGTVVVPASLKWQWRDEIERFTDQTAMVIDGGPKQRQEQYALVRERDYGYMVVSYDIYSRDWKHIDGTAMGFLVLDEATAIKNYNSARSKKIKVNRNRYPVHFALTGTPIENGQAEEIFSIMEFVYPGLFGNFWAFNTRYITRNSKGWIVGYRNLDDLHLRLSPYVARATLDQPEVAEHLPKVQHRPPVLVELDASTRRVADIITDDILAELDVAWDRVMMSDLDDDDHPSGELMARILALRMLLNSPAALVESADNGSMYAASVVHDRNLLRTVTSGPKIHAVKQYVNDHLSIDPKYKVVVFSTFVEPAKRITHELYSHHSQALMYWGGMTSTAKRDAVDRFRTDPHCRVLVSTDAGGYGLNLPEANLIVNFDLPWQEGLMRQRNARIRRASSKWGQVIVQDFVVEDSIEERMLMMLRHKTAVAEAIVDGTGITASGKVDSDLVSLRSFLTELNEMRLVYAS